MSWVDNFQDYLLPKEKYDFKDFLNLNIMQKEVLLEGKCEKGHVSFFIELVDAQIYFPIRFLQKLCLKNICPYELFEKMCATSDNSLKTAEVFLKTSKSTQGQQFIKKYINEHPDFFNKILIIEEDEAMGNYSFLDPFFRKTPPSFLLDILPQITVPFDLKTDLLAHCPDNDALDLAFGQHPHPETLEDIFSVIRDRRVEKMPYFTSYMERKKLKETLSPVIRSAKGKKI